MVRVLIGVMVFAFSVVLAQDNTFKYQSANSCGICHKSSKKGNQLGAWQKTKHANSLETLKSEASLVIAKEKGLSKPPSEADECLVCHVTGWGQDGGYQILTADFVNDPANARAVKKNNSLGAVGCEMCHGPGSKYKSKKTMEGIFAGEIDPATVGFVVPDENVCKTCHNEKSPTFKDFDYKEGIAKTAHPYPDELKAQRKRK